MHPLRPLPGQIAALVACARKLIIDANTVVSRQTPSTEKRPAT